MTIPRTRSIALLAGQSLLLSALVLSFFVLLSGFLVLTEARDEARAGGDPTEMARRR